MWDKGTLGVSVPDCEVGGEADLLTFGHLSALMSCEPLNSELFTWGIRGFLDPVALQAKHLCVCVNFSGENIHNFV